MTLNGLRNNVTLKLNETMLVFIVAKETYPYRAFAKFTQHNFNNQTVTLLVQTLPPPPPLHQSLCSTNWKLKLQETPKANC